MLGILQRYLPFIGRSNKRENHETKHNFDNGPALTARNDSTTSGSWCTIQSDGGEPQIDQASEKDELASESSLRRSRNLIKGAVSLIRRRAREEYVVNHDISNGREYHKIPAISYRRDDQAPQDFHYVIDHVNRERVNRNTSLSKIQHCECTHDCRKLICRCAVVDKKDFRYSSRGRLNSSFNFERPGMIKECNAACGCNPKLCKNMVIQRGPRCRVVLFRTRSRGWGVRTLENLKRGTFVGVYSGELLSSRKSTERQDDTYLFNLSNSNLNLEQSKSKQEPPEAADTAEASEELEGEPEQEAEQVSSEQFVCDAKFFGNYTRFINHSCNANVVGIKSFTDHQDPRYPHIAFFTCREVPANSELTLNYGDSYWLVKCKRDGIYCLCKQPECRFNKRTFPKTLREHTKSST